MAGRMAHRVAVELLRKITNRTRDVIKTTEWRVWASKSAHHPGVKHPNHDINYWRWVADVADLAIVYGDQLRTLAAAEIERLEA